MTWGNLLWALGGAAVALGICAALFVAWISKWDWRG